MNIVTDGSVIAAATIQVDNIRGIYGADTHITCYVHSIRALRSILHIEGYRQLPFRCAIVVDEKRCADPVSIQLEYRRGLA